MHISSAKSLPLRGVLALICASILSPVSLSAQAVVAVPSPLPSKAFTDTLHSLFNRGEYSPKHPEESRWYQDGNSYTILEPSAPVSPATDPKATDLVAYDTATGKRSILVPAKSFIPAGSKEALEIDGYDWSADGKLMLIFTNAQKVWRQRTRGDYWLLRLTDGKLTQIGASAPATSLMFAKFSPDSKFVGYVSQNNIYVQDLESNKISQLTTDGSTDIINGTTDWVTEEELALRDAFRWSPDSKSIAYWQFDQSGVGEYSLINDTRSKYPEVFRYKYPQPGGTNASVRVGVISAQGGATQWIKLPGDPRNHYIPRMEWIPAPDKSSSSGPFEIALEYLNRLQNTNQVYLVNATTGDAHMLFEDKDAAWVDVVDELRWLTNLQKQSGKKSSSDPAHNQELIWLSERDGWQHAYLASRTTGELRCITNFPGDVIEEVSVDETGGWFYFIASPTNPTQRYLYRSKLDGTGAPERVTPQDQPGTHGYDISPNGQWAIHHWQSASHPPSYDLVDLRTHKSLRTLVENDGLIAKVNAIDPNPVEFTETQVSNNVKLSTYIVKPPNFDPTKKYPMLVFVYSEPASATVRDYWNFTSDKIMAREGYVIVSFDNEGTPEPKGRAWRKAIYGSIGVLSTQRQDEAIVEFAKEHSFIDTTRVGMWGHSGGGSATLNEIFRHPGRLAAGVAIAPMADQLLYDSIYQEHYMGLPADNSKGYHDGSPINFAQGLADPLLIIHGSGDDNVHFQGTEILVDKLIANGKAFDFMDYPNRTHALSEGKGTLQHRYTLMMHFFEEHIPPGPR